MKKISLFLAIIATTLLLSSCTSMVGSTFQGKMVIYDQDEVVKGTPQYVGEQMAGFEKDKALAAFYSQLAQEEDPKRVQLLMKKINNLTEIPPKKYERRKNTGRESRFTY